MRVCVHTHIHTHSHAFDSKKVPEYVQHRGEIYICWAMGLGEAGIYKLKDLK